MSRKSTEKGSPSVLRVEPTSLSEVRQLISFENRLALLSKDYCHGTVKTWTREEIQLFEEHAKDSSTGEDDDEE